MSDKSPEQTTPEILKEKVSGVLSTFEHPTLKRNLLSLKALHQCAMIDDVLHIELVMPFVWKKPFQQLIEEKTAELRNMTGAKAVEWKLKHNIATLRRANDLPGINGVRNILAVSSGKGGVGKSSTAVNLALALAQEGAKVGILDADIYGPSIPNMLGTTMERPTSPDGQHMAPIMAYGLASNSIGYLVTDDNAMVWRGPMASKALMQMLQDTLWPDLDYLVIDMPPGTGAIQLTLSQNMSAHICSNCGHLEPIFGTGGAEKLAEKYHCQLLGQIPLHISLREDLDRGQPTVMRDPEGEFADIYREIASTVSAQMYWDGDAIPTEISFRAV